MPKKVVTDKPNLTGYLHGSRFEERRETANPQQQSSYEDGYRRGAKDTYKVRFSDATDLPDS